MTATLTGPLEPAVASFGRWLRFENKSENTVAIYLGAARKFAGWLDLDDWSAVRPEHVRDFIITILDTRSAGYANNLFRALQQFWKWYAAEHEVPNPMAGMSPPALPEQPVPVLRIDELKA